MTQELPPASVNTLTKVAKAAPTAAEQANDIKVYARSIDFTPGDKITVCLIHPELKYYRVNWYNNVKIRRSNVIQLVSYAADNQTFDTKIIQ